MFNMFKKIHSIFLIFIFSASFPFQAKAQDQEFPFDQQCLKYDKANFKDGGALLDVMITADFPQYCVLYSLSNYQVKQKRDDGYFIIGSKSGLQNPEATTVFFKSKKDYRILKPVSQWAYFVGVEKFMMDNGQEKEFYMFQEQESPQPQ